ncbi:MAG: hypothetical protein Q9207_002215 [Kuettlingeria erythrocarpa]
MEHFERFRAALSNTAASELKGFECVLRDELARRAGSHCTEVQKLKEEIEELRPRASRARELELELQGRRAHRSAGSATSGVKNQVDPDNKEAKDMHFAPSSSKSCEDQGHDMTEDHGSYRQRFIDCSRELQRVKDALWSCQQEAKRWKQACKNLHHNLPWKGPAKDRQHTRESPKTSSATAGESPSHANPVETRSSYSNSAPLGKSSPLSPRAERIHSPTRYQRNQTIVLDYKCEDAKHDHSPKDVDEFKTLASQAPEDGDTELDIAQEEQLPPIPWQDNDLISKAHLIATGRTESAMEGSSENIAETLAASRKRKAVTASGELPQKPKRLKVELSSSSPTAPHVNVGASGVHESIDLDDVASRLYTPRKDRRQREQLPTTITLSPARATGLHIRPSGNIIFQDANTLLEDVGDKVPTLDNGNALERFPDHMPDEAWCHREGQKHAARLIESARSQRREEARAKQGRHNRRERIRHTGLERPDYDQAQRQSEQFSPNPAHRSVLQPTNANKALPRTRNYLPNQKREPSPTGWHHGAQYISCISEDGESGPNAELIDRREPGQAARIATSDDAPKAARLTKTSARHRLDQLLAKPSPDRPRLTPNSINTGIANSFNTTNTPTTSLSQSRQPNATIGTAVGWGAPSTSTQAGHLPSSTKVPVTQQIPTTYISPFSKPSSVSRNQHHNNVTPPLRFRSLSNLSLSDFKVNPAKNQGFEHPFKETVRSRDQRKCLPGCTRLECCGTIFRKMAETGLFRPYHTSGLFASSQEDEDQKMMEDFLGDQAYTLRKMSKKDKAEVLLKAKTMILADHFGKHREVYAREPSPVGYWDVDMPNSQEAAEQKRMAEARTRQKVEERYNAAMKTDGEWKFRDE